MTRNARSPSSLAAVAVALSCRRARGHGYMSLPPSRQYEAFLSNGWDTPGVDEYGPHSIRAAPAYSECADCGERGFPGKNPWSAPGTASSAAFATPGTGALLGACGASWDTVNDYNAPSPDGGGWGRAVTATYAAVWNPNRFKIPST